MLEPRRHADSQRQIIRPYLCNMALREGYECLFLHPNWAVAMSVLPPADPGGRPSPLQISRFREVDVTSKAARPPSSANIASIPAWASSVSKKDIHIPGNNSVSELRQ